MELMKQLEVWFLVGSQHLYGAATLKQVADHAHTITSQLNEHAGLPVKIVLIGFSVGRMPLFFPAGRRSNASVPRS